MRKRLIFACIGGVVGIAVAAPLADALYFSYGLMLAVCGLVCAALGYVVSTLVDVFSATEASDES